ncbi:hypothetical protein Hdeb2414_s0021g00575501 [Helianthus debilis subsp. tardiflorus]
MECSRMINRMNDGVRGVVSGLKVCWICEGIWGFLSDKYTRIQKIIGRRLLWIQCWPSTTYG